MPLTLNTPFVVFEFLIVFVHFPVKRFAFSFAALPEIHDVMVQVCLVSYACVYRVAAVAALEATYRSPGRKLYPVEIMATRKNPFRDNPDTIRIRMHVDKVRTQHDTDRLPLRYLGDRQVSDFSHD